jgi:hypothetical protein
MSKRFDNKKLILILAALVVILLLTVLIKIPKQNATLRSDLVNADTSAVTKIVFIPRASVGQPFDFTRESSGWILHKEDITSVPKKGAVDGIFNELLSLKPQNLAAADESAWKEYELTDSLATQVKFLDKKDKVLADIMIGKFTYRQVNNPYAAYGGGGNNIEGTSYVRLSGEKEIYAVNGFLSFSFSGNFDDWRDRTFVKCNRGDITKITFTLPADSSFVLEKRDSIWYAGNQPADSLNTINYLSTLGMLEGQTFRDNFKPAGDPVYRAVIEGNNMLNTMVRCYRDNATNEYILNSSMNPDVFYSSNRNALFSRVFKPESYFEKKAK